MKNSIKFIFRSFSVVAFLGALFLNTAFAQNNVSAGNTATLQNVPEGCMMKKAGGQPDFEFVQKPEYETVLTKQRFYALDEDGNIIGTENLDDKTIQKLQKLIAVEKNLHKLKRN